MCIKYCMKRHNSCIFLFFFFLLLVFEAQFVILTSKTDAPLIVNAIVMLSEICLAFSLGFRQYHFSVNKLCLKISFHLGLVLDF